MRCCWCPAEADGLVNVAYDGALEACEICADRLASVLWKWGEEMPEYW